LEAIQQYLEKRRKAIRNGKKQTIGISSDEEGQSFFPDRPSRGKERASNKFNGKTKENPKKSLLERESSSDDDEVMML
jgi:hypothetical protein